jgi:hypothetical protein
MTKNLPNIYISGSDRESIMHILSLMNQESKIMSRIAFIELVIDKYVNNSQTCNIKTHVRHSSIAKLRQIAITNKINIREAFSLALSKYINNIKE